MNLVLTGSSTGIGRELAIHLLSKGHAVCGIARSDQSEFVRAQGDKFRAVRCDVSSWMEVRSVAAEISRDWQSIDGLIACTGIQGEIGRALDADPNRWSATVRANLDGTYFTLRAFAPLLRRASRRAKIICFSGGGATKARPNFSAYGSAKAAIVRLVETIAEEERALPLDINAIAPGAINTRLTDEILALGPAVVGEVEYAAATKQKESGGASLAKIFALVDWLLSPASDAVSGRILSAPWDDWTKLEGKTARLGQSDLYTLRRIAPADRPDLWL